MTTLDEAEAAAHLMLAEHEDSYLPECMRCHTTMESPEDNETSSAVCQSCADAIGDGLARTLLAVLPVVGAAIDLSDFDHDLGDDGDSEALLINALNKSIDTMRRALEKP